MKKMLMGLSFILILIGIIPIQSWAAGEDGKIIHSKNGKQVEYGVPYYLFDKELPTKGGVTYEAWSSYDYAIFAHDPNSNGTPIVIEHPKKNTGDPVRSGDVVRIRSVGSNWGGWNYWDFTSALDSYSVWFTNSKNSGHVISYSDQDDSVGIGTIGISVGVIPHPVWIDYKGNTKEKAWMTAETHMRGDAEIPTPSERNTQFYLYEEAIPPTR
ncbi:hypothetical protein HRD98_11130 [Enterococcus faecalis]|nr:hypothetical protein [Enterococcus faecalis]